MGTAMSLVFILSWIGRAHRDVVMSMGKPLFLLLIVLLPMVPAIFVGCYVSRWFGTLCRIDQRRW